MDQVNSDSSIGVDVIDDDDSFDRVQKTDKCLRINDDDLFNSGWYDRYKTNREDENLTPNWGNEVEEEELQDVCQVKEEPAISNHMEITEDWLKSTGYSSGDIRTERDGMSPYNRNQDCEFGKLGTGFNYFSFKFGFF